MLRTDRDIDQIVAEAMSALAQTRVDQPLPDPSFIWWKAQLLRRREAEREATAPIEVGERFHLGAAVIGAVALAIGAWNHLPALAVSPLSVLALAAAGVLLVSIIAFAIWDGLRH